MSNYVVIGAGVIGITNAHEILKANPNNKVTIVAQHFPTDFEFKNIYTSPIAGANWESFAKLDDTFVQEIDTIGYRKFYDLIRSRPEAGVTKRLNSVLVTHEKFRLDGGVKKLPWFASGEFSKEIKFREYNDGEFDKEKFVYGFEFDGMVIRTTYYLSFLINECWRMSGAAEGENARFSIKRGTVSEVRDAFQLSSWNRKVDYVINCTGLLSRNLLDIDIKEREKMYPVRGCVYVVKNNVEIKKVTVVEIAEKDEGLYIMPRREGELIIGGCFQVGNEDKIVDDALSDRILSRCKKYLPQYNWDNLEIVRKQVGFRPFRKGGYRIEREGRIIHCYGMGGAGYQSSWGCAQRVQDLILCKSKL